MRRNFARMALLFGTVFVLATVFATYAFFTSTDEKTAEVEMGRVDSEFATGTNGIETASLGAVEETKTLSANFEYRNNSTIDTFVRFSYSMEHKNAGGAEILVDQSGDVVLTASMSVDGSALTVAKMKINTAAGYQKEFLIPINVSDANYYYRLAPGQNISGEVVIEANVAGAAQSNIILATETIQATEKALVAAAPYGWDVRMFN